MPEEAVRYEMQVASLDKARPPQLQSVAESIVVVLLVLKGGCRETAHSRYGKSAFRLSILRSARDHSRALVGEQQAPLPGRGSRRCQQPSCRKQTRKVTDTL